MADETADAPPPGIKVVVLGARGRTGKQVVDQLAAAPADKVAQVVAVARDPSGEAGGATLTWAAGDVKNAERMTELFQGADAVVFAAAASEGWKLGGTNTPKQVDYEAVVACAKAAAAAGVGRYVVVSSAFVARPFHPIALMLSAFFGKVMQWKRRGELEAIAALKGTGTAYTIVRPGGLNDKKPSVGLEGLQISQGDVISGLITREDTARATVASLFDDRAKDTVFEVVAYKDGRRSQSADTFFSKLRPNDGRHDKGFYPADTEVAGADGKEPTTDKTDL